jgi:hypothetical protein
MGNRMDASLAQHYDVEPPATLFVVNSGCKWELRIFSAEKADWQLIFDTRAYFVP